MRPTQMMTTLLAASAALLVGCAKPTDPTTVTTAPASAAQALREVKEGERLTAMVYVQRGHNPGSYTAGVKSIEQCLAFGREATYVAGYNESIGKISCLGEDMAPIARFVCKSETARCESVLKF